MPTLSPVHGAKSPLASGTQGQTEDSVSDWGPQSKSHVLRAFLWYHRVWGPHRTSNSASPLKSLPGGTLASLKISGKLTQLLSQWPLCLLIELPYWTLTIVLCGWPFGCVFLLDCFLVLRHRVCFFLPVGINLVAIYALHFGPIFKTTSIMLLDITGHTCTYILFVPKIWLSNVLLFCMSILIKILSKWRIFDLKYSFFERTM